jgi:hypothetical protein
LLLAYQEAARNQGIKDGIALAAGGALLLTGASELALGYKILAGSGIGGGFNVAGQVYKISTGDQKEGYRYFETLVAAATAGLAGPFASSSVLGNAALGGAIGGTNTLATNWWYEEDASVLNAARNGMIFGGLGTYFGNAIKSQAPYDP